nr:MAG TPA: hypothetical protein [Caudoviricetes sp.]
MLHTFYQRFQIENSICFMLDSMSISCILFSIQ